MGGVGRDGHFVEVIFIAIQEDQGQGLCREVGLKLPRQEMDKESLLYLGRHDHGGWNKSKVQGVDTL